MIPDIRVLIDFPSSGDITREAVLCEGGEPIGQPEANGLLSYNATSFVRVT